MKITLSIILSIVGCASAAELDPTQLEAKRALETTVKMEEYGGSIFTQARLDKIDYRPILRRAIDHDEKALASLFTMRFMGEGGETHCANLLQLMKLWGDDEFSKTLARQPAEIRDLVIGSIDYAWADPEWRIYNKTLAASPESVTERTKEAEQGGADQPATALESKFESKENPNPKSEARPR